MSELVEDMYLGDGVYASFDGWHIWLDLRASDTTCRIALEPSVLANLDKFRGAITERIAELRREGGGDDE